MKATVFIDVQNDFIDGSLGVDKNHAVADRILDYARMCKDNGVLTVATKDIHFKETYHDSLEGEKIGIEHCIEGTKGAQLYGNLEKYIDRTFVKTTFMSKDLGEFFENLAASCKLDEIEIVGFVSSVCVISNALYLRGLLPNTKISIVKEFCADVTDERTAAALDIARSNAITVYEGRCSV